MAKKRAAPKPKPKPSPKPLPDEQKNPPVPARGDLWTHGIAFLLGMIAVFAYQNYGGVKPSPTPDPKPAPIKPVAEYAAKVWFVDDVDNPNFEASLIAGSDQYWTELTRRGLLWGKYDDNQEELNTAGIQSQVQQVGEPALAITMVDQSDKRKSKAVLTVEKMPTSLEAFDKRVKELTGR